MRKHRQRQICSLKRKAAELGFQLIQAPAAGRSFLKSQLDNWSHPAPPAVAWNAELLLLSGGGNARRQSKPAKATGGYDRSSQPGDRQSLHGWPRLSELRLIRFLRYLGFKGVSAQREMGSPSPVLVAEATGQSAGRHRRSCRLLAQVQGQASGDARKALKRSVEIKLVDQFGEGMHFRSGQ